ncbi:hypothetical protein [Xanthomonas sp. GPE 39]|uniref:hypothetical protein n=1 Tax=Xanthomonas sp. GPE 39 TaxID=1583099 RepID=UPI001F3F63C4|nr:hypothetical protein [Xanthomonas sp. GPE 39]
MSWSVKGQTSHCQASSGQQRTTDLGVTDFRRLGARQRAVTTVIIAMPPSRSPFLVEILHVNAQTIRAFVQFIVVTDCGHRSGAGTSASHNVYADAAQGHELQCPRADR